MKKSSTQPPLYEAMDFAIVRTPLLPVEAFLSLQSPQDQHALLKDPRVQKAVAVGSISLSHALQRIEGAGLSQKDEERAMAKLLRYQIRMSTRPTPYGLFAGCAAAPFANNTDLAVRTTYARSQTRPDMAWLMNFVAEAESNPLIRNKLRFIANPLVQLEAGRVSLATRMPGRKDDKGQAVSVRATRAVTKALELARTWIEYGQLSASLRHAFASAAPEKIDRLLDELHEQTILLTDLRPPLTSESPAQYVLRRLRQIPEASETAGKLETFLQAACQWDRVPHAESVRQLRSFLKAIDCPEDGSRDLPCQVDMAIAVDGAVGSAIALEAERAAQILLRLSPSPGGLSSLAAYRNAFVSRYGHEREVPLTELLDPARGLGPVSNHGHAYTGPAHLTAKRNRTLLNLACAALHRRQRVLMLDETTLGALETSTVTRESAPVSLDINLMIGAKSAPAIDKGEFTAVIGPNLGAWAACRNFGRFAHLHSYDCGTALLKRCAEREQTNHFQDYLWVEVVYLPSNVRSANVAVRPAIRSHEILFGVAPGIPEENVLTLEDLVVGVDNNCFYVRSQKERKRIRFVSGHMLNHHGAPAAVQFLLDVAYDGLTTFNSFDWGPAEAFPFLPRVQVGRIVLRPAQWTLTKGRPDAQNMEAFNVWRKDWSVPRYVSLTFGDNRLILDLECPTHVKQILTELPKSSEEHPLQLQEVLPALDETWLQGPEGHYYGEFIVPLVLRPLHDEHRTRGNAEGIQRHLPLATQAGIPAVFTERSRPPGSEWLFAKLYCPAACEDELIAERLLPMAENAIAAGIADSWFFIRYADPQGHVRLRFHGEAERLSTHLFSQISQWAQEMMDDGICTRLVFDTYDRELERFGGPEGMLLAERIFHADSRFAAELLRVLRSKQWEDGDHRTALFALCLDDLFQITGFSAAERLSWYQSQTNENDRDAGMEYRRLKAQLRRAIGEPTSWLSELPFGDVITAALTQRAEDLSDTSTRLLRLVDEHQIAIPVAKLFASYAHLHVNRIGAARFERMLVNLLFRTRASLANAPVPRVK